MIDFTIKKQTSSVTRDQIIDYLDQKFWEEKQYKCMPENEYGYEYVPREALGRIVDGLIPMIKNMVKQKNNKLAALPLDVPTDKEIEGEAMSYSSYPAMPDGHPEFNIIQANDFDAGAKWAIEEIKRRNQK